MRQSPELPARARLGLVLCFQGPLRLWLIAARPFGIAVEPASAIDDGLLGTAERGASEAVRWMLTGYAVLATSWLVFWLAWQSIMLPRLERTVVHTFLEIATWGDSLGLATARASLLANILTTIAIVLFAIACAAVVLAPYALIIRRSFAAAVPVVSVALRVIKDPAAAAASRIDGFPRTRYALRCLLGKNAVATLWPALAG